ncbi:hypothetical protein SteCoe_25114 [Stentor coeruleus]|uniref:PKD/REJ-like domain-containing protein n=1 Tax=Stentor coeruleus TaxID=5963 RepID=A0A1R2BFX8_9CILI|nr:hypothetical protein SteCoe_25114 [Stentor coeruleus]
MVFFWYILSLYPVLSDYLAFNSISFNGLTAVGSVSIFTSSGLINPISNSTIRLYSFPSLTIESSWEVTTVNGIANFTLNFWCLGTFQIVATSKEIDTAYSKTFIVNTNDLCYPLTINLSKTSVLINETFKVNLYAQTNTSEKILCHYKIVDSNYENIYGNSESSLSVKEIEFEIYMKTPGIKNMIAECYGVNYNTYITNSFQIYVNSADDYKINMTILDNKPKNIAEMFSAKVQVYNRTGMIINEGYTVYLTVIGNNELYGYAFGVVSAGEALFPNLSFMAMGCYQLIATSSNIYSNPTSVIYINETLSDKYLKVIINDRVIITQFNANEIFTLIVQIYFGTSLYTESNFEVNISRITSNRVLEDSFIGKSISGQVTFNNLFLSTEGIYAYYASAQGTISQYSQTFYVTTKDYIKITLNSTNIIPGDIFTVILEVFIDKNLTISEYKTSTINMLIYKETSIQKELSGSTYNGILVFTNLSLALSDKYNISTKSDTINDANHLLTIQKCCALLNFTNDQKPDCTYSVFSVIVTLYKNCSYNEIFKLPTTVFLSLDPEEKITGVLSKNTLEGRAVFDNLSISTEGIYKIQVKSNNTHDFFSDNFTIKNDFYLKVSLVGPEPKSIFDLFIINATVYVGGNFSRVLDNVNFEVNLGLNSGNSLKGKTINSTVSGVAVFNNIYIDKIGSYQIYSTANGVHQGNLSTLINITNDACARLKFENNAIPDNIYSKFSVIVGIYKNCSSTEKLKLNTTVNLTINPNANNTPGVLMKNTTNGEVMFENLTISTIGTYRIEATANKTNKAISNEFTIHELYLNVSLIGPEPKHPFDLFKIKVSVCVGKNFSRVFDKGNYNISLSLTSNDGVKREIIQPTVSGVAVFNNISLDQIGIYEIASTTDNVNKGNLSHPLNITYDLCANLTFVNNKIPDNKYSSFSVNVTIYKNCSFKEIYNLNKIVNLKLYSSENITGIVSNETFKGNTSCEIVNGYAVLNNLFIKKEGKYKLVATVENVKEASSNLTIYSLYSEIYINGLEPKITNYSFNANVGIYVYDGKKKLRTCDDEIFNITLFIAPEVLDEKNNSVVPKIEVFNKTVSGIASFENLKLNEKKIYTIYSNSTESFQGNQNISVNISYDFCAKLDFINDTKVISTYPDNILSVFSVKVETYTNCLFIEKVNLTENVSLALDTEEEIIGNVTSKFINGTVVFDNLKIKNRGTYKLITTAKNVQSAISNSFKISNLYFKISFIGEKPNRTTNFFSIKVEVFVGMNFIRIFNESEFNVNLSLFPEAKLNGITIKTTVLGVAIFDNLYIDQLGAYEIHASSKEILETNPHATLNITNDCPDNYFRFDNQCIFCYRWLQSNDISASLTNYLKDLIFKFSLSVIPVPCETLFPSSLSSKFGFNYSCEYSSNNNSIIVHLGYNNSLSDETISLNPGLLKGINNICGYTETNLNIKIAYVQPLPQPVAKILAPSTVFYDCENLNLDGGLSTTGIKSILYYNWKLTSSNKNFTSIVSNFTTNSTYQILSSSLVEGIINVELTVKNHINSTNTTTKSVISAKSAGLIIEFDETIKYSCLVSKTCMFSIKQIKTCLQANDYDITWTLKNDDILTSDDLKTFWDYQNTPRAIKIPAKLFIPSILYFSVNVFSEKSSLSGSQDLNITIEAEEPVFILEPLSGSVSSLTDLTLDASKSFVTSSSGGMKFSWFCSYNNVKCPFDYNESGTEIVVPKEVAEAHEVDFISVIVSTYESSLRRLTESDLSVSSVFVPTFVDWIVPNVYICEYYTKTQPSVINSNKAFVLKAIIEDNGNIYEPDWEIVDESGAFNTPSNQFTISINPSKLTLGLDYQIKFLATDQENHQSFFYYNFYVNKPPLPGTFIITPSLGIEMDTVFELLANGWTDFEENYPLSYIFGYIFNDAYNILLPFSQTAYGSMKLPYIGKQVQLFLKVYDSLEDYTETLTSIEMSVNENFDITEYVNEFEELMGNALPNEISLNLLTFASLTVNRDLLINGIFSNTNPYTLENMNKCFNIGIDLLLQSLETFLPTQNSFDLNIEILNTFTLNPYLRSDENFNKTIDTLSSILNMTKDFGLNSIQANRVLNVITNSINLNKEAVYNKSLYLKIVSNITDTISLGLIKNIIDIQNLSTFSNNVNMDMVPIQALNFNNLSLESSSKSGASVNFPNNFSSLMDFSSESLYLVSLTHLNITESNTGSTPTIVSVSVFLASNQSLINVQLNDSYIYVEIPVYNIKKITSPECFYLDEVKNKWSTNGCKIESINEKSILCACNHLSFFSAGDKDLVENPVPKPDDNETDNNENDNSNPSAKKTTEGFYLFGVILLVYCVLVIYTFIKDKNDMEMVIERVNNPNCKENTQRSNRQLNLYGDTLKTSASKSSSININQKQKNLGEPMQESQLKIFEYILQNHNLLGLFFCYNPRQSRLTRSTIFIMVTLGNMYFIGVFYDESPERSKEHNNSKFSENINDYNLGDFAIMINSSLIMIALRIIITLLTAEKLIDFEKGREVALRVIKINIIKRVIGLLLCLTIIVYFSCSIGIFIGEFYIEVSHIWMLNTIISIIVDLLFTSFIEIFITVFIVSRLLEIWRKYKERKLKEEYE